MEMSIGQYGSLSSFRQRLKTFPDSVKIHMIYEIALGMNFLHTLDEPIIHRDLKLDNVFVSKRLEAKVGDFGLATWCNASDFRVFAGTLTHIPPEQLEDINTPITTKCDVYSFGITLWELATGLQAYENCICNSKLLRSGVLGGQRPDKNKIPENEPLIIKTLMEKTWHQNPAQRPDFKDIKDRIKNEFDSKYKQQWEDQCMDVRMQLQLSEMSVHKDQSHEETAKFPWENYTVLDSPNTTNTGTPEPLQSADSRPGAEVKGYPVAASDDGAQANILGHSRLMNQITTQKPSQDDNLGRSLSKMTLTSSPVQATPDIRSGAIQASDAQLHESELRPSRPYQNRGVSSSVPSSNQASHVPSSNQASHVPSSNQASHVPSSDQASHVPSSNQASHVPSSNRASHPPSSNQAFEPRSSSEPNTAPQANININVTGHGNITSVGGDSVIIFGRRKHKKKSKKNPTPPPSSSSSSSSSDDTDAATVRTTDRTTTDRTTHSITTSREPVTEKIISKIEKHIGKKWKNLGRELKLTDAEIENVEGDYNLYGRREMAHQVMLTWQRSRPRSEATKAKLAKALVDADLTNVAEML